MDRLHSKGYISDPKSKAKSVMLSEEGEKRSKGLFAKYFSLKPQVARKHRRLNIRDTLSKKVIDGLATIHSEPR
jgi:hypothetical protein